MKTICRTLSIGLITFFVFFQFSCKKNDKEPESNPAVSTSANPNNYFGVFSSSKIAVLIGGFLSNAGGISNASFSSQAFINNGIIYNTSLDAGSVSINGISLKKNNYGGYITYNDTTYNVVTTPHAWKVSTGNGVPAINYNNTDSYPTYTGYTVLQDTIYLNQNNRIQLQGVGAADEIEIVLTSMSSPSKLKFVSGTSTSVVYSPADLSGISPTNTGLVNVICFKNSYQLIEGKTYKFQVAYQVQKSNLVFK